MSNPKSLSCLFFLTLLGSFIVAADKAQDSLRIAVAVPFAIPSKSTSKVVVRGWMLDRDLQAKSSSADVSVKVLRHEKAPVPNGQDAKQIGDSQVELEIALPEGFSAATLPITLFSGESESIFIRFLWGACIPW